MSFIDEVKQRAKKDIKTIVLPEAEDIRIAVNRCLDSLQ